MNELFHYLIFLTNPPVELVISTLPLNSVSMFKIILINLLKANGASNMGMFHHMYNVFFLY